MVAAAVSVAIAVVVAEAAAVPLLPGLFAAPEPHCYCHLLELHSPCAWLVLSAAHLAVPAAVAAAVLVCPPSVAAAAFAAAGSPAVSVVLASFAAVSVSAVAP